MRRQLLQNVLFYLIWMVLVFALLSGCAQLGSYFQGLAHFTFDRHHLFYSRLALTAFYILYALLLFVLAQYGRTFVRTVQAVWLEFSLLIIYSLFLFCLAYWPFTAGLLFPASGSFFIWLTALNMDGFLAAGGILSGWSLCFLIHRLRRIRAHKRFV